MKNLEILMAIQHALNKFPYYGPILARCRVKEDDDIETLAISNRLCITYNKQFFLNHNDTERMILVLHECMHPMSDHHHRYLVNPNKGKISFTIHNIAMDMEINQHLKKEASDFFIKSGWLPEKMNYPDGKSYEYYLDMIIQDIENDRKQCPNPQESDNGDGIGGNDQSNQSNKGNNKKNKDDFSNASKEELTRALRNHQDFYEKLKQEFEDAISKTTSNLDMTNAEETDEESQSELQDVINECKEAMRTAGVGNEFCDIVRKAPRKKYDWRVVLKSLIRNKRDEITRGRDKMTFTKINRRMAALNSDVIFSEKYSENYCFNLVVGVDVSGSMGDLTTEMYSRLKSIDREKTGKSHITVVECDSDVTNVMMDFEPYVNTINSTAGGGTDMEAIPRWVEKMVDEKKMEEPDLIIIMTDNYCSYSEYGHPKYAKKTVVLTNNPDAAECPYKIYEVVIDD